jgi:hypothetical protein
MLTLVLASLTFATLPPALQPKESDLRKAFEQGEQAAKRRADRASRNFPRPPQNDPEPVFGYERMIPISPGSDAVVLEVRFQDPRDKAMELGYRMATAGGRSDKDRRALLSLASRPATSPIKELDFRFKAHYAPGTERFAPSLVVLLKNERGDLCEPVKHPDLSPPEGRDLLDDGSREVTFSLIKEDGTWFFKPDDRKMDLVLFIEGREEKVTYSLR